MNTITQILTWYAGGFILAYCMIRPFLKNNWEEMDMRVASVIGYEAASILLSSLSWLAVTGWIIVTIKGWFKTLRSHFTVWFLMRKLPKHLRDEIKKTMKENKNKQEDHE